MRPRAGPGLPRSMRRRALASRRGILPPVRRGNRDRSGMNAGSARAATAFGLRRRGAVYASDIDAMRARATSGRIFRANDAGDNAAVLMDADLGYTSRIDQALRCPAEPFIESGT